MCEALSTEPDSRKKLLSLVKCHVYTYICMYTYTYVYLYYTFICLYLHLYLYLSLSISKSLPISSHLHHWENDPVKIVQHGDQA